MTLDAITRDQADALAAFAVTLRPGQTAWTKTAVLDQIGRVKDNPGLSSDVEVIARAVIRAARTASIRTPQVISMTGEHWEDKHVDTSTGRRLFRCPRCGRIDHDAGADCYPPPVTGNDRDARIAAVRAAVKPTRTYRPSEETNA